MAVESWRPGNVDRLVGRGHPFGADQGGRVGQLDHVEVGRVAVASAVRSDLASVTAGIGSSGLGDGQGSLVLVEVDPLARSCVDDLALVVPVDLKRSRRLKS